MISFITGTLDFVEKNSVFIDNNGIGYEIKVLNSAVNEILYLAQRGEKIKIHTFMLVKDDSVYLYGFLSREELKTFKLLMTVSGVGPKAAANILDGVEYDRLPEIISTEDIDTLSKISGVGKKTAQRLIIELRDKISTLCSFDSFKSKIKADNGSKDAIEALCSLGYQRLSVVKIVDRVISDSSKDNLSAQDIIKQALKLFGKN